MTEPAPVVSDDLPAGSIGPRAVKRSVSGLIAVAVAVVLLGIVLGAVWAVVTPALRGRVVSAESAVVPATAFGSEFAAVGTFALLLFGYGVGSVVIGWTAARSWRGPTGFGVLAVATTVGSLVAAVVGIWVADWRFGDPRALPIGATFEVVPDLWLDGAVRGGVGGPWVLFACAPLSAALVYLGAALASRTADLGVGDLPTTIAPG
ncbi:DUF2567 domain-containing protein [Gordonia sp. HNM0687]|uniref:DUF2567 domain-containing protein n=1 Tax=Gordonia mangrovi TaxID=2665643 RepID=A0A6L7GML4_9ACTN|nr:DUF2567 domain-containing protein [Gordonia mangrovi]MXP21169.1 DUF2567 domain-containing protein [Gordonia mangrovi]UVF78297.1 DUF2567 domain-containing protein [Gordonia mangrovi]